MKSLLLVRYGEIHLKGQNRPFFERRFLEELRAATAYTQDVRITRGDGRFIVEGYDSTMESRLLRVVSRVYGTHSVCPAVEVSKDFDAITEAAITLLERRNLTSGTFKVEARRSDKRYPMSSPDIGRELGARLLQHFPGLRVDVHTPEHRVYVEIREKAHLFTDSIPGVGGMPVGTSGRGMLLLSGGIDSPVAGWMMAKRGMQVDAVHFHSFPYTSDRAKQKVLDLAQVLAEYSGNMRVHVVPFTAIQETLHEKAPDEMLVILMRRAMMRIAQTIAVNKGCGALITGESVGQVASQTVESLTATNDGLILPVFRPLIGFDKTEIIERAQKIGTFDISIQPFEDCCTVFVPRHPVIHPKLDKVREAEGTVDIEPLLQSALQGVEVIDIQRKFTV